MKKKLLCFALVVALSSPLMVKPAKATNFEGKEDTYYKLCSSKKLSTSKQKTCKEFNSYLKTKSSELKEDISDTKDNISSTESSITDLAKKINKIDKEISDSNKKITYTQKSIANTKKRITKKENQLKERIYSMQSELNSNIYIDYLFGADNFTDFFSRVATIGDITAYENELMDEIKDIQKDLENQEKTLNNSKAVLVAKKKEAKTAQASLNKKLKAANIKLKDTKQVLAENQDNIDTITENMKALAAATEASKVSGVTKIKTPTKTVKKTIKKTVIEKVPETVKDEETGETKTVTKDVEKEVEEEVEEVVEDTSNIGVKIANKALTRIGAPYVWGGCHSMSSISNKNQWSFDCSGLVSWAYYQAGKNIGVNYTGSLAGKGKAVSKSSLQPGDIILFSSNGSKSGIHHVGIYIGNNQMVHAPTPGKTVCVVSLSGAYWQREWYQARRLY